MTDDGNYSTMGVFFPFLKECYRHPKHFKQL